MVVELRETHMARWFVYAFFEIILTEFRPGPVAFKTVLESAPIMNELNEARVRPSLMEVGWST